MIETVTGGCQCGRIRHSVVIENDDAYVCHCKMCRRATGGISIALKGVKIANVSWEREPDRYQSSPIAQRGFCSACGTPLTFEYLEPGENTDLTVSSFDDPSRFARCSISRPRLGTRHGSTLRTFRRRRAWRIIPPRPIDG